MPASTDKARVLQRSRDYPDELIKVPFNDVGAIEQALSCVGWARTRCQTAGDRVPVVIAVSCELARELLESP